MNEVQKSIDWQLSLTLANNRSDLAQELLDLLVKDLPNTQQQINQSFAQANYDKLQQQVHKLHGATCYCGVPRLKQLAKSLEQKLQKQETQLIPDLMQQLNHEIQQIITIFSNEQYQQS